MTVTVTATRPPSQTRPAGTQQVSEWLVALARLGADLDSGWYNWAVAEAGGRGAGLQVASDHCCQVARACSAPTRGLSARDQRAIQVDYQPCLVEKYSTAQDCVGKCKRTCICPPPSLAFHHPRPPVPVPNPRAQLAVTDVPRWGPLLGWHCE